ncbi:hypothetical protein C9374_008374 [Naegleria lovaniensis]|uniref:MJ1316 RNA cyclic group end recognition domain-containing protein n=1 Tax=Naegleria lovaniensis TaxID=51637 RepID=A0AA88GKP0_NAELO|nr:uncharacterized protein C9374_008374 [Naegleria lovaniensis]KAG2378231.1 hypothetical protein C9374_008374 [Naegleria lovaniensis]
MSPQLSNPVNINNNTTNSASSSPDQKQQHMNSKNLQIAREEEEWLKKKPKFLTCKEALDRIMWDQDLSDAYSHLSMVYKDRFEGDTLISYEEFLNSDLAEELPQHRIQQLIYRDQFVFWDKRNRIDMLSNGQLREFIVACLKQEQAIEEEQAQEFTTILQPSTQKPKKQNKKNKKIMKEFVRAQDANDKGVKSSDDEEEDELERYMEEYDEEYSRYLYH